MNDSWNQVTGSFCESKPAYFDGALVWLDQAAEHLEQGGLARAIAPDEAEAFAAAEFEGDVFVGPEFARPEGGIRGQESGVRSQGRGGRISGQETGVRSQGRGGRISGQESGVRSQ